MTLTAPKMIYTRLGNTGMRIKDEEESIKIIKEAYNAGINFFDTANVYSNGQSEIVLGKALRELKAPRGRVVIATKVFFSLQKDSGGLAEMAGKPELVNDYGLSRKHIFDAVDASLKRLGVDYIDLYQIHRLDRNTPMEEIMEALNDLVRSGKVRYIGASSMHAWEFQKLNSIAERRGWTKFVTMQNLYNLLSPEEEREMNPYCVDAGIAGIPWSPLAMGKLTGKNRNTVRTGTRCYMKGMTPASIQESDLVLDRVEEIAKKHNAAYAQIALAWMYTKKYVTSPIVGVSKVEHLHDLMGAFEINLTEEEVKYLEEPYTPRNNIPF